MSHKVIDANYFAHPKLSEYLEADPQNKVVFTDFASMEAYGGHAAARSNNSVVSIAESMSIVCRHPRQVVVLKSIREIITLQSGYPHATPEDFIDLDQTAGFAEFCQDVQRVRANQLSQAPVLEHGKAAAQHIGVAMLDDARAFPSWFEEVRNEVGIDYVRRLRSGAPLGEGDVQRIIGCVLRRAGAAFMEHPDRPLPPRRRALFRQTLIFRLALAHFALAEWFLFRGGPLPAAPRLRNDLVDMTYVACATFFDGLLTAESKMVDIHDMTVLLLNGVFA